MRGYVVDASVAVKWLIAEPLSDESAKLLDADVTLPAPDLLFAEATSALAAKHRHGELDPEQFADAVDLLRTAPVVTADTRFHDKVRRHPYLADRVVHVADL